MTDTNMTNNLDHSKNPRDALADLFTQSYPNIIWAIHCAPAYKTTFNTTSAYTDLTNHADCLLGNIEVGLEFLTNLNTVNEQTIAFSRQINKALQ
jgi:hypothetical protein